MKKAWLYLEERMVKPWAYRTRHFLAYFFSKFLADTLFIALVGFLSSLLRERLFTSMTWNECWKTRAAGFLFDVLLARFYGIFRDLLVNQVPKDSVLMKRIMATIANILFWGTLYFTNLIFIARVNVETLRQAGEIFLVLAVLSAWFQDYLLEKSRKKIGQCTSWIKGKLKK